MKHGRKCRRTAELMFPHSPSQGVRLSTIKTVESTHPEIRNPSKLLPPSLISVEQDSV